MKTIEEMIKEWIDVTCEELFDSISKFLNELKGAKN